MSPDFPENIERFSKPELDLESGQLQATEAQLRSSDMTSHLFEADFFQEQLRDALTEIMDQSYTARNPNTPLGEDLRQMIAVLVSMTERQVISRAKLRFRSLKLTAFKI